MPVRYDYKNKMSTQNALERYTVAKEKVEAHIEDNKAVFDTHQKLVMSLIDAENELRDTVSESREGVSNGKYTVSYLPQTQTWADIETIDQMIATGLIKKELREKIVMTQERPARISIKENK